MFSEEGSNSLKYKKAVCSKFVKYLQDVTSGRTVTTLENILELATGASEEQVRSNCWALPNNQAFILWFPMCLQERPPKTTSVKNR